MENKQEWFKPEYNLSRDAFVGVGRGVVFENKLEALAIMAKEEPWNFKEERYKTNSKFPILTNYLFYTYDRLKEENKITISEDNEYMCFNTGLQTRDYEKDIYAYFIKNINKPQNSTQDWMLSRFYTEKDKALSVFKVLPDIAEYCENPSDLIFDKRLDIRIDYEHIVDENLQRFTEIGLPNYDEHALEALLESQAKKAVAKVKRNYKVAIPQYYADRNSTNPRIQLLLPLCFAVAGKADLALVISKEGQTYIGKTILHLDWAYMNSRRIVTPDVCFASRKCIV
ncbi:DUF3825 domain-containing protein [Candidatus Clostridium stratigraminis]|uniref:DUF3825 domain-containing protein n=1 Tax=Candidatus Clostridium stratigraminis TaxID=3381661 RepID=A0ABW8T7F6_9CLOT